MTLTIAWENFAFASQTKWSAYPEWGMMVKISYFSTSMVILFLGLQFLLYFIKNKLNKKILNKSYALIIYGILMVIGAILNGVITKKIADNTKVWPFLIVALILAFVFVTYSYEYSYPFEGNDPGDMMELPADFKLPKNLE